MSSPFIGEIRMFAGNFAPTNWAFCDGQQIPIAENDTLFNLIGTTYGGDGQQTFALPDLRGRLPIHQGQGPELNSRIIGELAGSETVTVTSTQMPSHTHPFMATSDPASSSDPTGNLLARASAEIYTTDLSAYTAMSPQSISVTGQNQPHSNMMPYLVISFIISLFGIFPSQN